jgi:hypothetical protein
MAAKLFRQEKMKFLRQQSVLETWKPVSCSGPNSIFLQEYHRIIFTKMEEMDYRELLKNRKRIVVKIGSSSLFVS